MSKREKDRARYRHLHGCQVGLYLIGIGGIVATLVLMWARNYESALITAICACVSGAILWAQTPKEGQP